MAHICLSQTGYLVDTIMLTNVKDHLFHLDLTIYAAHQLKKPFSVKHVAVKNNKYTPPFPGKIAS